ncbi:MAG TPA: NADH:flavin oxidoreductase/NADH oxidase [Burkholderiales bacterium]|nr:NADH:flavin oxidoreductase/NADH oxidase [Burkholderiales bacterium]
MTPLFSPCTIGDLTLKNRIVIAPMCQYSAQDGNATDWHTIHLGQLALSGAALLILEATAVEAAGRISPDDLGLWSDANELALKKVLDAIRPYSSIPFAIQLAHAGRKASCAKPWEGGRQIPLDAGGWQTVAPSALPYLPDNSAPEPLDADGLRNIAQAFALAAQRAHRIGMQAIEIHAAHGYLLHQFLSPLSNDRKDQFGGSLENRMRFPLAVFDAVRAAIPADIPVGVRISATDWVSGGWDIDQSVALSHALREHGCAYIHVSSGGLSPDQKIPVAPGYQVPFAAKIRSETGMPVMAVGLITEPEQAEAIIAGSQADMVSLARGMLYDPRWPWHAAAKLGAEVDAPPQYWRSQPHGLKTLFGAAAAGRT